MTFAKYLRFKKLVSRVSGFHEFIEEVAKSAHWYGVPYWTRENYLWLYSRVSYGYKYHDLINE